MNRRKFFALIGLAPVASAAIASTVEDQPKAVSQGGFGPYSGFEKLHITPIPLVGEVITARALCEVRGYPAAQGMNMEFAPYGIPNQDLLIRVA